MSKNKVTTSQLTNVTALVISLEMKIDHLSGRYSKFYVFVQFWYLVVLFCLYKSWSMFHLRWLFVFPLYLYISSGHFCFLYKQSAFTTEHALLFYQRLPMSFAGGHACLQCVHMRDHRNVKKRVLCEWMQFARITIRSWKTPVFKKKGHFHFTLTPKDLFSGIFLFKGIKFGSKMGLKSYFRVVFFFFFKMVNPHKDIFSKPLVTHVYTL